MFCVLCDTLVIKDTHRKILDSPSADIAIRLTNTLKIKKITFANILSILHKSEYSNQIMKIKNRFGY